MTSQAQLSMQPLISQRPHWIDIVVAALFITMICIVALMLAAPALLIAAMLMPPIGLFLRSVAAFYSTSVTLHSAELKLNSGIMQRASFHIPITRIESVEVLQSIAGRALNYGTLVIRTVGGDSVTTINLRAPDVFSKEIYLAMSRSSGL